VGTVLALKKLYLLDIFHDVSLPSKSSGSFEFDDGLAFIGGVLPLLKKFGNSLGRLKLEGFFHDIDTSAIIELCPNLHSLILSKHYNLKWSKEIDRKLIKEMERVPSIQGKNLPVLKNLERLVLNGVPSSVPFVSSENLLTLLSSPSLSFVELQYCDTLTDEILQRANDLHSFRNLERLIICYSDSLTNKGIDILCKKIILFRKFLPCIVIRLQKKMFSIGDR
jgi:hypothetical protein